MFRRMYKLHFGRCPDDRLICLCQLADSLMHVCAFFLLRRVGRFGSHALSRTELPGGDLRQSKQVLKVVIGLTSSTVQGRRVVSVGLRLWGPRGVFINDSGIHVTALIFNRPWKRLFASGLSCSCFAQLNQRFSRANSIINCETTVATPVKGLRASQKTVWGLKCVFIGKGYTSARNRQGAVFRGDPLCP